jgi:hypothetical protein
MAKTDTHQSDGPEVIDRRKLLTAAAAMTAASTVPTTAEGVCEAIQSSILPPGVRSPKACAATAQRLLEISRRNELRRMAQLPLLSIPKEFRRMKEQEELEVFRQFEAANGRAVWEHVLEARRQAEGNLNWRSNWMESIHFQNQAHAALRARFGANTIDKLREVWPRLSPDEKKLFDVIARAYLAALMPDFRYRQTTATLDVRGFEFRASGRQPIDLGWRAAFADWQPADEKGDEAQLLPPLRNGETAQLHDPKIENKETRPPPRYNEGTLIEAMQNAWRFVDDEVLRERLKEAKGIGTPATRAEIIGG